MNRRNFMSAILAAGIAPAVVRAASLMPVRQLESGVVLLGDVIEALDAVPYPTVMWVTEKFYGAMLQHPGVLAEVERRRIRIEAA